MKIKAIPGMAEAVAAEQFARNVAFAPVCPDIAGLPVQPLSWERLGWLMATENIFIMGGGENLNDRQISLEIARFLWLVSPQYSPRSWWRKKLFFRRLRRMNAMKLIEGITDYLDDAFMDLPRSGLSGGKSLYSIFAGLVDLFGHEYGWTVEQIMALKLNQSFQFQRAIEYRLAATRGKKAALGNPSDECVQRWLDQTQPHQN